MKYYTGVNLWLTCRGCTRSVLHRIDVEVTLADKPIVTDYTEPYPINHTCRVPEYSSANR